MNKQPFYYRAVVLFTSTRDDINRDALAEMLKSPSRRFNSKSNGIIGSSIEVEECDAEPGDPADLL